MGLNLVQEVINVFVYMWESLDVYVKIGAYFFCFVFALH